MRKKFALVGISVVSVLVGVAALSAYEAHIVNVTAHIENALKVFTASGSDISFGTVFPQEYLDKRLYITTSKSFCEEEQDRVLDIGYKIVQKPKPIWPIPEACEFYGIPEVTIEDMRAYCHDYPEDLDCCYPLLCPYLSKIPVYKDPEPFIDFGVPAFHDPKDPPFVACGVLHKYDDLQDEWIIDLDVPCFEGMCAQDWTHFGWELDPALEEKTFGCDLWVEVTELGVKVVTCCIDSACVRTNEFNCKAAGGTINAANSCIPNPCD